MMKNPTVKDLMLATKIYQHYTQDDHDSAADFLRERGYVIEIWNDQRRNAGQAVPMRLQELDDGKLAVTTDIGKYVPLRTGYYVTARTCGKRWHDQAEKARLKVERWLERNGYKLWTAK